jgi:hypothetical protein
VYLDLFNTCMWWALGLFNSMVTRWCYSL